jgi:hypothetical protein
MRALIVVVEGETEAMFIREVLGPALLAGGIFDIRPIQIPTSPKQKGGLVDYIRFRNMVIRLLKQEQDILVTSMVDFYGLPNDFPDYERAHQLSDSNSVVDCLEAALSREINENRFIPYIQLHEFEGLLFTSEYGFKSIGKCDEKAITLLRTIIEQHPNPEQINDGPLTAPSKRLKAMIPRYDKVLDGNYIALENGIQAILDRCPRFRNWVETLIARMQAPA